MVRSTRNGTETYAGAEHLPESEYHRLLAAERRRTTLDVVAESTAPVELEDLAATVAARETGRDVVDEEAVERVARSLHHSHLPKMDDLGVIDYDPDAARVESCP